MNPLRGGRQQPHQSLEKFIKYRGGRKCHPMVVSSCPRMFMCNHSFLKANSMLDWMAGVLGGAVRSNGLPSGHTNLDRSHLGLGENMLERVKAVEVLSAPFGPEIVEQETQRMSKGCLR